MDELTQVDYMQAVALQPGDRVVARTHHLLSDEQAQRLKAYWEGKFSGHEVIVVDGCCDISVLSKVDRLGAIERKLDQLIAALAEDGDEEPPCQTLDGMQAGGERDQTSGLA